MEGLAHRSELARAGGIRNDPDGRSSPGAEASCCRLLPSAGRAGSMLSGTKRRPPPPRVVAGGAREQEEEFREVLEEEEVVEGGERERGRGRGKGISSSFLFSLLLFSFRYTAYRANSDPATSKGERTNPLLTIKKKTARMNRHIKEKDFCNTH